MNDCEKCRDFAWCSGEELDSEACPVRSGPGLSVSLVGFTYEGIKYYSETRFFIKRSLNSIPMEDVDARVKKHEISEAAYKLATEEIYANCKPLKNSDGSFSYSTILNSNESTEITFWKEA